MNNYGPYTLTLEEFALALCRGPKLRNLTTITVNVNEKILAVNYTFLFDAKINEIKASVFKVKGDKCEHLYNYRLGDPCKHFMLSHILKQYLKVDDCVVKKGFYINKSNFGDLLETFLGNTFFYGKFTFKSLLLSKTGNIACFLATFDIDKKK